MNPSVPFSVAPGTVLGADFTIVRPLSQGGMGAVYVARQASTGAERAVKVMHSEIAHDVRFRQRFEQEARVGSQIRSDHVVHVIAAGVDESTGMPWFAMELLEGVDLASYLHERGKLTPAEVAIIGAQLGHALSAAHVVGIVHRDLKPENVFLTPGRVAGMPFVVKVLDFGIAKVLSAAKNATMALGTPLYMAPEQASRDSEVGPDTDVWAMALMVFHLLTGRSYWRAADADASPVELWREVLVDPIVPATVRAAQHEPTSTLPEGFDAWFARCLVRDRAARYRDATIASFALAQVLAPFAPVSLAPSSPLASPRPPSNVPIPTTAPGPRVTATHLSDSAQGHPRTSGESTQLTPTHISGQPMFDDLDVATSDRKSQPALLDRSSPAPNAAITTARLTFREPTEKVVVHARRGESILASSLEHGLPHYHACNGNARCTTCRVLVLEGETNLSPRTDAERKVALDRRWPENIRLSCQARILGDATVRRLVVDAEDEGLALLERQSVLAERPMVVLKVTLRDYATYATKNLAHDTVHMLHKFLRHAAEPVEGNYGVIERFTGSGLVALFGSTGDRTITESAEDAVRAALRIQTRTKRFNQHALRHFGTEFEVSLSIDTSAVILAELGPRERVRSTSIGPAIDGVDRLEFQARAAKISLAVSRAVVDLIRDQVQLGRSLEETSVDLIEVVDFVRPDVVCLVQTTFERVAPKAEQLSELFYDRLFAQNPAVEILFEDVDMRAQREMLIKVLATAVRGLEDLPSLVPTLESLGRRHVGYGARPGHYKAVGDALLWALEQLLADEFTADTHLAWMEIYGIIARTMLEGARKAEAAPA